ncbi:unnamed protein product [Phytomonas sp. EM1]|nr:unnamed protein product [Phytomonas sp. EM1]|eukprot:CCW59800.1 unnamed protein product [Phytomonas sp. isolate EM1]
MILTPTTLRNLENVKVGLQSSKAVLIQGEIGCGKSIIVHFLAEQLGKKESMIQINVDDTFDNKDLLGKFSATDTPGTFEWVPGPLTVAVQKGYWILMEDIDLASFDVFSVILSLLENSTLFLADKNVTIQAHPDFKLIATQQLYASGTSLLSCRTNTVPFMELWGAVIMERVPPDEILTIIQSLYSDVPRSTVENLASLVFDKNRGPLLMLRDLLKWSLRVDKRFKQIDETHKGKNSNNNDNTGFIPSTLREGMLKEAFDCFLAKYPPGKSRDLMLAMVATACGVPENVANPIVFASKPIEKTSDGIYSIGRVTLPCNSFAKEASDERIIFAPTMHSMCLLERLAACVQCRENVLLSGETGVGKTFIVQYLAGQLGQKLIVHNLNQQTDTCDFMGGWKPLDVGLPIREAYLNFVDLFSKSFNLEKNIAFLNTLQQVVNSRKWDRALRQMLKGCETFLIKNERSPFSLEIQNQWKALQNQTEELLNTVEKTRTTFSFYYEEGSLVKSWREGHWILLDELNLASTEVLERVSSVLGDVDRLFLTDKENIEPILRHPNFRVFANMNPPTDVGKKDLPPSLRSRFTEFYVSEPFNPTDINVIVQEYIGFLAPDTPKDCITNFFLDCVLNAKSQLCSLDGESKPPSFSLRTLTRALSYVRKAAPLYGYTVALYDGLMLGFATPLQRQFHAVVESLIVKNIFHGKKPACPRLPPPPQSGRHVQYEHIWIPAGDQECVKDPSFILTDSVKGHLTNLARAAFANRPVLLEGPTSSGKSSMVKYLAELTGNKFVRINNHESTEVQEYLGHYVTDEFGKLRFVDGILVTAVRRGYWVVLDELNLAPTDVLEALNRLLDDNCELFIPDTQEVIKPHPQLRIFATQNPAGVYGGRKLLSRAFRNRFLEITVDEIPNKEVKLILQKRYTLPASFAEKMVEIMTNLQTRRQNSQIFAGRHGFITPRDLFCWAERKPSTFQELSEHGFLLLGERCRKPEERQIVRDVIESVTRTVIDDDLIYSPSHWPFVQEYFKKVEGGAVDEYKIVWTPSMQRLFTIVGLCLEHKEPALLVGETGSSKTTICQLWAALLGLPLHILNCHQHTEAADFLGCLCPVSPDRRDGALFEWHDGPLVQSMINGDFFVLDEISLAEDSVLEGLNSLLEPSRSITLTEKSSADHIVAHEKFRIMATMNPGGDFGKKELSPALRNRFTEIYVRPTTSKDEVSLILSKRLEPGVEMWADKIADMLCSFSDLVCQSKAQTHISIRDVISWVSFMNAAHNRCPPTLAFLQGFDAVILDGIGVGVGLSGAPVEMLKRICLEKAQKLCGIDPKSDATLSQPFWTFFESMPEPQLPPDMQKRFFFGASTTQRNLSKLMRASILKKAVLLEGSPGVGKTSIVEALGCALGGHVVRINLSEQTDIMDLLGSFLPCPNNQSEELEDSQSCDPMSQACPQFAWSDGILLRALKEGAWVILDELNLASQSVLEGLNALLDHRSTVFIPELNEEFRAHENFRVFACQNPLIEGGGRKGLPRSFLNRFVRVRVDAFQTEDLIAITKTICPSVNEEILKRIVAFVEALQRETMERRSFAIRGSPWEFNLRDVLRWVNLMQAYDLRDKPTYFADMLFLQRMRTHEDEKRCLQLLAEYFPTTDDILPSSDSDFLIHGDSICFEKHRLAGRLASDANDVASTSCDKVPTIMLLPSQTRVVKSLLICAEQVQFVLLVGPSGAGKTFALKTAASLVGAKLVTFSMTASCDTVDLLGGFDQVEGQQGQFEWRDSLLLEAMVMGYWLVLDNVNYCNASVLDRLNPLVEPNGSLSVSEQGLVNGQIRVIRPHPNFRLFATLNPKYGDISRAMRNRAVELFMPPAPIPSPEAAMLEVATHPEVNIDVAREDEWLSKIMRFHSVFLKAAFGVDSTKPASGALSDALAAGAPNIYTLQRSCAILRANLGDAASDDLKEVEKCILHRYINNRSGPWMYKKEELVDSLQEILNLTFSPQNTHVAARDLVAASQLNYSGVDTSEVLERQRVARQALALRKLSTGPIQLGDDGTLVDVVDVVFHFVLEQSNDSVVLPGLSFKRRKVLRDLFPSKEFTELDDLLCETYCGSGMLDSLYCQAAFRIGPRSSLLSSINPKVLANHPEKVVLTGSASVNQSLTHVLHAVQKHLVILTSPLEFQNISSVLIPFLEHLSRLDSLSLDNYVSVTTQALLLRSVSMELCSHPSDGFSEISQALADFIDSIRSYLDLPFSLIGGLSVMEGFVPHPHITTKEERSLLSRWQNRIETEKEQAADKSRTQSRQILQQLWEVAAYRAEHETIQLLLSLLAMGSSAHPGWNSHLRSLCRSISILQDQYMNKLLLFSELEMALWRSLLMVSAQEAEEAIQQCAPLLICRFITRYGLNAVAHLFPGSWVNTATRCLKYASKVSVLAIGQSSNDYTHSLSGLVGFLSACPVAPPRLFSVWKRNAQRELPTLVRACFSEETVLGNCVLPLDAPESRLVALLEPVRSLLLSSSGTLSNNAVKSQKGLFLKLLACLCAEHEDAKNPRQALTFTALLYILKCRLLLPQSPIDPMYRHQCEMESAREEVLVLKRLEGVFKWAEQVALRGGGSPQLHLLTSLRSQQQERLQKASEKFVERSDQTGMQYATLVRQLYQLTSTLLSDDHLDAIFSDTNFSETMQVDARISWSELLFQGVTELLTKYSGYEDVTLNFAQAALLASIAARASCYARSSESLAVNTSASGRPSLLGVEETIQLLQFPLNLWSLPLPSVKLVCNGSGADLRSVLEYLDGSLKMLQGFTPHAVDWGFVEGLFLIYRELYRAVEIQEREEQHADEMSVLYKERSLVIEGDDEKLLRRLKDLLPNYEQEFTNLDNDTGDLPMDRDILADREERAATTNGRAARHTRIMFEERDGAYLRRLIHTYGEFFERLVGCRMEPCSARAELLLESFKTRFDVLSGELARFGLDSTASFIGEGEEGLILNGFAFRAELLRVDLSRGATALAAERLSLEERRTTGFNLFTDADPGEVSCFSKPLERLLSAVEGLAAIYPDTVSLQRCQRLGRKIGALPALTTPLMRILAGCEVLLAECYEWERNAAKEVSIMPHITELSAFVLRWRRMELHCWAHVFKAKRDEFEMRASKKWFHLYDFIRGADERLSAMKATPFHSSDGDAHTQWLCEQCNHLFESLTAYLWEACYGDFDMRLQIVRSVGLELLATHGARSPLANVALHVSDFFAQFSGFIQEKSSQATRPIEEEMNEFTKIMRWEDANYYAVRATSEKVHLKVARALSSFEDVLRTPVRVVIAEEEQRIQDDPCMGIPLLGSVAHDGNLATPKDINGKGSRKNPKLSDNQSHNVDKKAGEAKNMKRQRASKTTSASKVKEPIVAANPFEGWPFRVIMDAYEFFSESTTELLQRVKALQAPKTPYQMKIRALKTLFGVLDEFGVPHRHEIRMGSWDVVFSTTTAMLSSRSVHNDQLTVVAEFEKSEKEYYKFVRWLQLMREAGRGKTHADLSEAQVRRGTGISESLFTHAVGLTELMSGLSDLTRLLHTLEVFVRSCGGERAGNVGASPPVEAVLVKDVAVLDAAMKLCGATQAFHGSLEWMLSHTDLRASEEFDLRASVVELGNEAGQLWQLCRTHEPLRRGQAPIPATLTHQFIAAARRLREVCDRLRDPSRPPKPSMEGTPPGGTHIPTAAAAHGAKIADFLARFDPPAADPRDPVDAKRPRTEAAEGKGWGVQLHDLLETLSAAFTDAPVATSDPNPAAASPSSSSIVGYKGYQARLEGLGHSTRVAIAGLDALLHPGSGVCNGTNALGGFRSQLDDGNPNELLRDLSRVRGLLQRAQKALHETFNAHVGFGVALTRLFTILMKKGFCKTEDDEDEGDGDGDGGAPRDGTGMDDGEGEKDVTNEMENEDQLMNMKDKEEQPREEQEKENGEDDEDHAADVETDFQAQKQNREESDADGEESDDDEAGSNQEMGSVDGEDERDRKKTRKDNDDDDDMREDEHDGTASEVPEDQLMQEEGIEGEEDETGGFEDKQKEIRDAEEKREGEHELVGEDDQHGALSDDLDDDSSSGRSRSDESGDEASNAGEDEKASDDETDSKQESEDGEGGSEGREDMEATTDSDQENQEDADKQQEVDVDREDLSGEDVEDLDSAEDDGKDENVFEGGFQDDEHGEEATKRKERESDAARQQPEATGNEEDQPNQQQEQDDAGRNWKKQQEQNQQMQRKDDSERKRANHNPYHAIKEALQRHDRQTQQLDLNQRVHVQKEDPSKNAKEDRANPDVEKPVEERPDAFEFDEEGEQEGVAATDEQPNPSKADEAEQNLGDAGETPLSEDETTKAEEDEADRAAVPEDVSRRRRTQAEEITQEEEEGGDPGEETKKKRKSRQTVRLLARSDPDEEEEEDAEAAESAAEEDSHAVDEKLERGRRLWQEQEAAVEGLSQQLCEQLRLVLAPTRADKLQGDYKTGKRLNMKRIIPYIASQFKKDRIWLRRTKPSKRTYQVMVALDDSLSMQCNRAGVISFRAVALLAKALQQLEVGEIGIAGFGKETRIIHPMEEAFVGDSGARSFSEITFTQTSTNLRRFLETTLDYLDAARERAEAQTRSTTQQLQQILFIISDGQITEDRAELRKLLVRAEENHQMVVFALLDLKLDGAKGQEGEAEAAATAKPLQPADVKGLSTAERLRRLKADREARLKRVQSNSILDMQIVEFKQGKVIRRLYMEDFPFPYYLIVRELESLPEVIADAMRQWFELLNAK